MNILGLIEIERKTDILALVAFFISVMTAIYQLGIYFVGPDARLLIPEGVTIARFTNRPGQEFVSVIAPISIVNTSDAREPLLVRRETALVTIGARSIPLTWHDVIDAPITDKGITFSSTKAVHPLIVDTKKIDSTEVRFTPQRTTCAGSGACDPNAPFVSMDRLQSLIVESLLGGVKNITVTFTIEFANHPAVAQTCTIPLMPNHLKLLREVEYFMELCGSP